MKLELQFSSIPMLALGAIWLVIGYSSYPAALQPFVWLVPAGHESPLALYKFGEYQLALHALANALLTLSLLIGGILLMFRSISKKKSQKNLHLIMLCPLFSIIALITIGLADPHHSFWEAIWRMHANSIHYSYLFDVR